METKNKIVYSVFSGTVYEIPEKDLKILDIGQVPLTKHPNRNCPKCYGRHYTGRDSQNFAYLACSCIRKVVDHTNYSEKLVDVSENSTV